MTFLEKYLIVVGGIVISLALPVLWGYYKERRGGSGTAESKGFFKKYKIYFVVAAISASTGIILLAMIGHETIQSWESALLAGYGYDSTIQKFTTQK